MVWFVVLILLHHWGQYGQWAAHSQQVGKEQLDNFAEDLWNYLGMCQIPSGLRNMGILRSQTGSGELILEAVCHPGFTLHGSSIVSCNRGKWNSSLPQCLPGDCLSHYQMGRRQSGPYTIYPQPGTATTVYCHMASFPLQDCHSYYNIGQQSNGFYEIRQWDGSVKDMYCFMSSFESKATRKDCLAYYKAGNRRDGVYLVTHSGGPPVEVFCAMETAFSVAESCQAFYNSGYTDNGIYLFSKEKSDLSSMPCAMSTVANPSHNCMAYYKMGYIADGFYFMKHNLSTQGTVEQYCALSTVMSPKEDCLAYHSSGYKTDGVYFVQSKGQEAHEVFCDMQSNGGGWTLIQKRQDKSVDFRRDYDSYKKAFGQVWGNYWVGLEALHQLTQKPTEVYIYLEFSDTESAWAHYSQFQVNGENDGFRLKVSGYHGTAGDAMEIHNGQKFSTIDKDQDSYPRRNCAAIARAGWWFKNCYYANLNGPYIYPKRGLPTISWVQYKGYGKSLRKTYMMIRRKV